MSRIYVNASDGKSAHAISYYKAQGYKLVYSEHYCETWFLTFEK